MLIIKILVIYLLIGKLYSVLIMAWFIKEKFINDFEEFKYLAILLLTEALIWPISMFQMIKILICMKQIERQKEME